MTDPRNAQPGSYGTSGYGAGAGEESRMAANSGRASVRPRRPGAASPAGWFPPPAGEAAPPVRLREPARSDGASPYASGDAADLDVPGPLADARARSGSGAPLGKLAAPGGPPPRACQTTPPRANPRAPAGAPDIALAVAHPAADRGTFPWSARRRRCAAAPAAPGWTCRPARFPACSTTSAQSGWQLAHSAYGRTPASDWEDAPRRRRAIGPRAPTPTGLTPTRLTPRVLAPCA